MLNHSLFFSVCQIKLCTRDIIQPQTVHILAFVCIRKILWNKHETTTSTMFFTWDRIGVQQSFIELAYFKAEFNHFKVEFNRFQVEIKV